MSKEELLLSLDNFKKKLTNKKAIKDAREKEAAQYYHSLVKEVNESGEKFVEDVIQYFDEYQNIVGDWSALSLRVDNSKYYFQLSYYDRERLYMDVHLECGRFYKVEYKKPHYYNSDATIGFPEINKHLTNIKHLFDGNFIKNKIANNLLERQS